MSTVKEKRTELEVKLISWSCKGCGLCVSVCRERKLEIAEMPNERGVRQAAVVENIRCTGCLRCTAMCPDAALEIYRIDSGINDTDK